MKKTVTIIILLFCVSTSSGQVQSQDTLAILHKKLQNAKHDTSRVFIMQAISEIFAYSNVADSSLFYILKSLTLARNIGYQKGELISLLYLENTFRHSGNEVKAFSTALKGLKKARIYKLPYYSAVFLGELGIIYRESGHYDKALDYLRQSKNLFDSLNDKEISLYQGDNIGQVHLLEDHLDSALYYCLPAFEKATVPWVIYYSSVNLGKIHIKKHEYDIALSYFKKSLRLTVFSPEQRSSHFFTSNILRASLKTPS